MECVELAPAFEHPSAYDSGSKLHALHALARDSVAVLRSVRAFGIDVRFLPAEGKPRNLFMSKIQRALLSVSDKAGLAPLAQTLAHAGVELVSTGGTAKALREAGLNVTDLSAYTGFPEMLDGRVKTLHPKVHGGLLYIRGNEGHEAAVRQHGIAPIDLVVVNLYPFEQTVAKPGVSLHEAIENIDIGGPSMLRSAAKNHESVTVVVDPGDYAEVAAQINASGETTLALRRKLAAKVFARTSAYDAAI